MYKYNDNELLYLIAENDDDAKDILINKYKPLIYKYAKKSSKDINEFDDYVQEGLLCLMKAINTYKENYPYSFNSYLNIVLKRKFIDISKKKNNNIITYHDSLEEYVIDYASVVDEKRKSFIEENDLKLSDLELLVYQYKFIENIKPSKIAEITKKDIKQIYDAINRIKGKINKNNKKI